LRELGGQVNGGGGVCAYDKLPERFLLDTQI